MTAGQSGPDQQGWQPPQPPPAYPQQGGHPGYGQPPQGQPPYGGYVPAPAAPTGWGAPAPVERPTAVRVGIGAFLAATIIGLIAGIVTIASFDAIVDAALRDAGYDPTVHGDVEGLISTTAITFGVVVGLLFTALYFLFIWFAWKGHNWARIVLWVLGGLGVLGGLAGLAAPSLGFLSALNVFQLILLIVGIVFLAQKPASEWYRYEGWRRSTGVR